MMQPDLFDRTYPDAPGFTEHTTSRAAALAMKSRAPNLRARVLRALNGANLTPDEIAEVLGESVLAIRPRVTELFKMREIEWAGTERKNRSGRYAHVFRLVRK